LPDAAHTAQPRSAQLSTAQHTEPNIPYVSKNCVRTSVVMRVGDPPVAFSCRVPNSKSGPSECVSPPSKMIFRVAKFNTSMESVVSTALDAQTTHHPHTHTSTTAIEGEAHEREGIRWSQSESGGAGAH
jgi:hypothetical protein